jgi:threonine/homoserine/homoserine lactone efflux protein
LSELVFGAIGYGLLLSVMVGPAFFVLIETSIIKGVKSALFLDLGVLIADLVYVLIAYFFITEVTALMHSDNRYLLNIIGGGFFIVFGVVNLLKKKVPIPKAKPIIKPDDLNANNYVMMILKGFMIVFLNPGVLFYWLTLMSIIPSPSTGLDLSHDQNLSIYILIILLTYFSVDVLKIIGAKKLKDILTPNWMRVVNLTLGIILILFGAMFLFQGVFALWK